MFSIFYMYKTIVGWNWCTFFGFYIVDLSLHCVDHKLTLLIQYTFVNSSNNAYIQHILALLSLCVCVSLWEPFPNECLCKKSLSPLFPSLHSSLSLSLSLFLFAIRPNNPKTNFLNCEHIILTLSVNYNIQKLYILYKSTSHIPKGYDDQ